MDDPLLFPVLRPGVSPGSSGQPDIQRYAVRDVRGVETPAANSRFRSGFNNEAAWTERAEAAFRKEHDPETKRHTGTKFPIGWIEIIWTHVQATQGQSFRINPDSNIRGVRHGDSPLGETRIASPPGAASDQLAGIDLYEKLTGVTFVQDTDEFGTVYMASADTITIDHADNRFFPAGGGSTIRFGFAIFEE